MFYLLFFVLSVNGDPPRSVSTGAHVRLISAWWPPCVRPEVSPCKDALQGMAPASLRSLLWGQARCVGSVETFLPCEPMMIVVQRGTVGLDRARATTCSGPRLTWTRAQMRKMAGYRPFFHFASCEVYTFKYVARRARRTRFLSERMRAVHWLRTWGQAPSGESSRPWRALVKG